MFITQQDLERHFGADNLSGFAEDKVAAAIEDANALAETHLAGRYSLPFYTTPAAVKAACCRIATRYLFVFDCEAGIQSDHDAALRWLQRVEDGKTLLVVENDPATEADESAVPKGVLFGGESRQYTASALRKPARSWEWGQ